MIDHIDEITWYGNSTDGYKIIKLVYKRVLSSDGMYVKDEEFICLSKENREQLYNLLKKID